MGIYDRDYYRREGTSFLGNLTEGALITKWLIGINVVCFFLQLITQTNDGTSLFQRAMILTIPDVQDGQVWRLLTYAFLHDTRSPWHILFNMLILWWAGRELEDERYGPREFLAIYLLAAFLGGMAYFLVHLTFFISPSCLGASGAVTAVLVLLALYAPNRVVLLMMVLPMPLWFLVSLFVAFDAFVFFTNADTSTAVSVHLAGALFAYLYWKFQWHLTGWWTHFQEWRRQRSRPRLRVYRGDEEINEPRRQVERKPEPVPVVTPLPPIDEENLEAKMDAVLEKLSRVGKENLSESEREVLLRASELIRRRRT